MSSSPSTRQWLIIILVNVVVSGVTAFFVFRALTSQLKPATVSTTPAAAASVSATSTPATAAVTATTDPGAAGMPTATVTATVTAEETATPAAGATSPAAAPAATLTPMPAKVKISAVLFPGQLSREVAVLVNQGDQVNLKDWTLSSGNGISYTFPDVILFKDNFINLHTMAGADVPTDLFWGRSEPAWKSGDTLTLTRGGEEIATFRVR